MKQTKALFMSFQVYVEWIFGVVSPSNIVSSLDICDVSVVELNSWS